MSDLEFYPRDYNEARARFRKSSERVGKGDNGFALESFQVPSRRESDLTVDEAYWPALESPDTLFILVSGVHGMEGATGSALQFLFLDELWPTLNRKRTGVWLVHAMNPFGYKAGRRATENNVNLNRNFAASDDLFQTPNELYEKIASFFEPEGKVAFPEVAMIQAAAFIGTCLTIKGFSPRTLSQAISQGQFKHPRGTEYGGRAREPQTDWFARRLQAISKPYRDIVLFDLHTGLGDRYQLHLIPGDIKSGAHPELLHRLFAFDEEKDLYEWTPTDQPGFYQTYGDINSLIPKLAQSNQRVLALTFEYGTLGNKVINKIDSLARLRLENQGYHHGFANRRAEEFVRTRFTELFYPEERRWRASAIARTRKIWKRVIERLNAFE